MEWPENYAYSATNKLMAGTRKLGHTVTPSYQPYTINSSDVLSSAHLLTRRTNRELRVKGGKVHTATYTGTTPFAAAAGVTATSLPGYQSLSNRKHAKVTFLPALAKRDTVNRAGVFAGEAALLSSVGAVEKLLKSLVREERAGLLKRQAALAELEAAVENLDSRSDLSW